MKLAPDHQRLLLELADTDAALTVDRAEPTLEEQKELDALIAERAKLRDGAAVSKMGVEDLRRDLGRLDHDLAKLERRQKADLDGLGAATDMEDRRDLEHDLASTRRRIRKITEERENMRLRIEATDLNHDSDGALFDEIEERIAAATRARDAALDGRRSSRADLEVKRDNLRSRLAETAPDALDAYDEQYESFGVGAARFTGNSCTACYLVLPAAGISRIRATAGDTVPRCPECGTWLIRG
ncbi:C4-type zinc ribbon domain-containing protein [Corynebacterium sp. CCM 8835]|uniref:C4-type zinc ribbon domain-containing protein n=1 Tax=Corynebacterium antarcticum TaxID=2800405 RepID=A0A9Q4CBN8_9CORY|nr:C4-type zinc ribbon domain-containing protein [Corynebacterium antarcticum]MCK7641870.1 C4-type zinc ribbon domain-containing protein [Corynebacterium antarcticum]MCK7660023.1 C4-type zinc ribbon domain-containing protein [Corynebacterium antarcticum]MCL0245099.1 C4-type zinc ribbon domain-containing protein [Corynebacterium antarcticum]MCX7491534.1 C4-type zinc ribbon domain-containing protein [Corynebacterium antarcticum]MCX7537493.1 C4-type zinc ribbon domain-containing protein [Coryneba